MQSNPSTTEYTWVNGDIVLKTGSDRTGKVIQVETLAGEEAISCRQDIQALQKIIELNEIEKADLGARIIHLESSFATLTKKKDLELERRLSQYRLEIADLNRDYISLMKQLESKRRTSKGPYASDRLTTLTRTLCERNEIISALEQALETMTSDKDQLRRARDLLQRRVNALESILLPRCKESKEILAESSSPESKALQKETGDGTELAQLGPSLSSADSSMQTSLSEDREHLFHRLEGSQANNSILQSQGRKENRPSQDVHRFELDSAASTSTVLAATQSSGSQNQNAHGDDCKKVNSRQSPTPTCTLMTSTIKEAIIHDSEAYESEMQGMNGRAQLSRVAPNQEHWQMTGSEKAAPANGTQVVSQDSSVDTEDSVDVVVYTRGQHVGQRRSRAQPTSRLGIPFDATVETTMTGGKTTEGSHRTERIRVDAGNESENEDCGQVRRLRQTVELVVQRGGKNGRDGGKEVKMAVEDVARIVREMRKEVEMYRTRTTILERSRGVLEESVQQLQDEVMRHCEGRLRREERSEVVRDMDM